MFTKRRGVPIVLALISCLTFGQLKADVEPNDDIASANPLALATEVSGTLNTGETDANDYYEIDLPENGLVEVSIDYDGAGGFAYLYRSNGVQITFVSVVDGSPNLLSADCIGSGIIYVRLSSSGEVNYSLEVNLTPPADAEDAEPNGSLAAANEFFQANQSFSGQLGYIGEESGNVTDTQDWFYVVLDSDGDVTLTVEKDNAFSGFIYIHEKDGTQLTFASANELVNSVTAPCLAQDTIVVRITHSSGCGSYTASVSVTPPVFAGDQEPNGSLSAAQEVLQINEEFTGRLGYSDADTGTDTDDWFFVVTGDDGELTFDLESTGTLNGFFYFYEKDGTQITNTSYNNGNNQLTVNCIANDTVAVRIIRSAGCGSYNASISVTPPPNAGDQEPNGAFENIIETFDANQTFTGRLGYTDADTGTDSNDWYEVVLDDDGLAAFEITPSGTFNGFIYFYSKAGVQLANTSFAANTQTTLLYDCIAEDTVVVRVLRSAGCGSYSAVVSVTPPDLAGDVEPNGAFRTFQEIFATDEEFTGRLGYFDTDTGTDLEDWYEVVLSNDGTATLDILSTGSLNGFIYIYSKAGVLNSFVAYQDGEPQSLSASCLAQDTVAVRITRSSGCGSYTASLGVSPDVYTNDPEPNNSFGDAVLTNGGVVNEGHLGYFDVDTGTDSDDYYTFVVGEAPFTVDAELQVVGSLSGFMYFYNESGSLLVNTTYSEGQNILSYEFTEEGTYFFRVLRSSGCGQYQLAPLCGTNPDVSIAEGDQTVCPGETPVEFSATPGIANYEWVFDGQIVGTESTLGANEPGDYFVRGIDANGCIGVSETVSLNLFNVPALSVNPTGPIEICEGESETLSASGGFASYLWSNGASGQSIDVTESGSFSVTATTADGCSAESNQVVVDVKDVPGLNIVADGPTEFCEGESVTLSANDAFDSYLWSNGEPGTSIEITESGIYSVTGTTADGCTAVSNEIEVTVSLEGECEPDCAGVPGGESVLDECGVCRLPDDPDFNSTCTDCAGVVNGDAFIDNCGDCVGGTTGQEPCEEDCFGVPGGDGVVDDCGVCREPGDPDFNSTCLDCAGVPNGDSVLDECGVCRLPDDPDFNSTCTDCAGVVNGESVLDECGVCRLPDDPDFNSTCADCEGVPNGPAQPGTACDADGVEGSYDENCNCVPEEPVCDNFRYFLANANEEGGSDIYEFSINDPDSVLELELIASVDVAVSLAYDGDNSLLYMVHRDQAAIQTLDVSVPGNSPSAVQSAPYGISGFTGAAFADGLLYAASENENRIYSYDPNANMGQGFSQAAVGDGDIAFGLNGSLYLASTSPTRAFQIVQGNSNIFLGFVPQETSGLALLADGNFLVAVDGRNRLVVGDSLANGLDRRYYLAVNGSLLTLDEADLASGCSQINIALMEQEDEENALNLAIAPNPTTDQTWVTFSSGKGVRATLEVYDVNGRRVAELFSGSMSSGVEYRQEFDASHLPNGIYICRYSDGQELIIEKIILSR